MIKKTLLILTLFFFNNIAEAQINNIHNFYSQNLFFYSPAHTGDKGQLTAFVDFRKHLLKINNSAEVASVGLHSPITKKMSLGGLIKKQKNGLLETVSGRLDYSFRTKINKNSKIAFGINVGMLQRGINQELAIVVDQTDPTLTDNGSVQRNVFYSGASIAYSFKNIEFDIGIPTMYQTKGISNIFQANYWSFLAYSFYTKNKKIQFKPSASFTYNTQNTIGYNANFLVNYKDLIWVQPTYKANQSLVFSVGFNLKKIGIAYSYETNSSSLNVIGGASHEIMLTYGLFRSKIKIDTIKDAEYYHNLEQKIGDKTYEEYVTSDNYGFYNNIIGLIDSIHQEEVKKIEKLRTDSIQQANKLVLLEKERLDSINSAKIAAIEKAKRDSARAHNLRHLSKQELKILEEGIHFKLGSAVLSNDSKIYLNKVAILIRKNKNIRLLIAGHTCDIGSEETNLRISKQRANAVISYLIKKGVSPNRITSDFKLDAEPIVPNTNEENRSLNRRVSFSVIKE